MTAEMVRLEAKEYLTAADFTAKDPIAAGRKFDALFRHITLMPEILRFKAYDPHSRIIWSDDKRLIGRSFPDDAELQEALRGEVVADMSSLDKRENVFDRDSFHHAVELYTPVYARAPGGLIGVIEIYKNAAAVYRDMDEARLLVLMGVLGGGALLYLALFAIVRQAAQKINEQQENLLAVQSELVASQRMAAIGEMAAAVAHGIGNPLSSIRAAAQVAKLGCADYNGCAEAKRTQRNLRDIMQQVDRVQKRIRGLLNFVRPLEPRPSPVNVNLFLKDIVEALGTRFEEAEVAPHLELDFTIPETVLDPIHIEQVFQGLLTNAIEATPAGGTVTVNSKTLLNQKNSRLVCISIEDTGEGIPVENRERIFEPFFTTKPHGTGIGLLLAKKFVERNGGKITISEGAKGGTRVEVIFPVNGRVQS